MVGGKVGTPRRAARVEQAQASTTSAEELTLLARDESWRVRAAVACHPSTPVDVWRLLAQDPVSSVRRRVLRRTDLEPADLDRLVHDQNATTRQQALRHPQLPAEVLVAECADNSPNREPALAAAALRMTELATLLATQLYDGLRALAASSPESTPAALTSLAQDSVLAIRLAVAANPTTPVRVLGRLAASDPAVARVVATRSDVPRWCWLRLTTHWHWSVRAAVAGNVHAPDKARHRLVKDPSLAVRCALAACTATPAALRDRLAIDHPAARLALLTNLHLTSREAVRLRYDESPWVSGYAVGHPALPADEVQRVAEDLDQPGWLLRRAASHPSVDPAVRDGLRAWLGLGATKDDPRFDPLSQTVAPGDRSVPSWQRWQDTAAEGFPAAASALGMVRAVSLQGRRTAQPERLIDAATDPDPRVRWAVTGYRPLPANVLAQLQADPNSDIARHAATLPGKTVRRPRLAKATLAEFALLIIVGTCLVGYLWRVDPTLESATTIDLPVDVSSETILNRWCPLPGVRVERQVFPNDKGWTVAQRVVVRNDGPVELQTSLLLYPGTPMSWGERRLVGRIRNVPPGG
ncbi:MAG: hypothetical protein ACKO91_12275, partial [Acidimicrobiales bacterium]